MKQCTSCATTGTYSRLRVLPLLHCIAFFLFACLFAVESTKSLWAQSIQWETVASPAFDMTDPVLKMAVTKKGTLVAALQSGGVYASSDNGKSWQMLPVPSIFSFAYVLSAEGFDSTLYLGTTAGLWASSDEGQTWTSLYSGAAVNACWKTPAVLLVGTEAKGLLRSANDGKTWETLLPASSVEAIVATTDNVLFASVTYPADIASPDITSDSSGIYRSTDEGATWQKTTLQGKLLPTLTSSQSNVLLAGTQEMGGTGRVYRSTDGGEAWSTTPLQDIVTAFVPLPSGSVLASAANSGMYVSENNGQTWKSATSGLLDVRIMGAVLHPSGYIFAHDVFSRIYRSSQVLTSVHTTSAPSVRIVPSAGELTVVFTLHNQQHIRLVVCDVLGRRLPFAFDEVVPQGEHTRSFSSESLVAGVYFYRIETSAIPVAGMFVVDR